jgi:hypothetical protein
MVTMAVPRKALLRCKNPACRKVVMGITGMVEVEESGIGITKPCKCGTWNEWKVIVVTSTQ